MLEKVWESALNMKKKSLPDSMVVKVLNTGQGLVQQRLLGAAEVKEQRGGAGQTGSSSGLAE